MQRQEDPPHPQAGSGETTVCCCAIRRARLAATCCHCRREGAPDRSRLPTPAVHNSSRDGGSSSTNSLNPSQGPPDEDREERKAWPVSTARSLCSSIASRADCCECFCHPRTGLCRLCSTAEGLCIDSQTANPARRRRCISTGSFDLLARHVPDPAAAPLVSRFSARGPPRSSPPLSDPDHGEGIMCPPPCPRCTLIDSKFPACRRETCAT